MPNDPNNGDMEEKDATLEKVLAIGATVIIIICVILLNLPKG